MGGEGYAHHYLAVCKANSKMNEVDASIYRQLIDIDSKLGTNASLQLWGCLNITNRSDLIQVWSTLIIKALNSFQIIDLEEVNEYEELKKAGAKGFAHEYLNICDEESKSDNEIDIQVYDKLVQLDSKLGTTASEQLTWCLYFTTRSDIIKVNFFSDKRLKSIQTIDFEQVNEYQELRKAGPYGFADAYLNSCNTKAKSDDEIDVEVYTKLVELDSKLGTTASKQLDRCLFYTTRSDIIQVLIFAQNSRFKIILDYRLRTSE